MAAVMGATSVVMQDFLIVLIQDFYKTNQKIPTLQQVFDQNQLLWYTGIPADNINAVMTTHYRRYKY